tara:strand:+ start:2159 stop:2647 length:489 start_codon:yes stop_codon:yes gene_type:complete
MKKKNLRIDFEYDFNFYLIGICCALKDYQICYKINKELNTLLFRSTKDIEMTFKETIENTFFSLYEYWNPQYENQWYLLGNKTMINCLTKKNKNEIIFNEFKKIKYLIPEHYKVDFYIQIHGILTNKFKKDILNNIQNISQIVSAYEINCAQLKSKENLIIR